MLHGCARVPQSVPTAALWHAFAGSIALDEVTSSRFPFLITHPSGIVHLAYFTEQPYALVVPWATGLPASTASRAAFR